MCPIPQNPNTPAIMAIKKAKPLFLKGMEATVNLYNNREKPLINSFPVDSLKVMLFFIAFISKTFGNELFKTIKSIIIFSVVLLYYIPLL